MLIGFGKDIIDLKDTRHVFMNMQQSMVTRMRRKRHFGYRGEVEPLSLYLTSFSLTSIPMFSAHDAAADVGRDDAVIKFSQR